MKLFYVALLFINLTALGTPSSTILSLPHRALTLKNGMRVYLVKYPSPNAVAYQIPVHVGSRNEIEKGKTGFAHFFEHLMFRGTKTMSSEDFDRLLSSHGVSHNAWTWFDMTNYHGVCATIYLAKVLTAEADRFKNLYFDEKSFRDEAGAVLGEYNKSIAQPEFLLEEKLLATAFKTHPYGHTTMGYKEDILQYTKRYKDVWPFFKMYYRPSNVSIVLVGDIDFNKTARLVEEKFGSWKDTNLPVAKIPAEEPQTAPRSAEVKISKPTQTRVTIAYKVPRFSTTENNAAVLQLISEMTFSKTSDFQKIFRFEKKWLDSVDASPLITTDPGLWSINLRFSALGEPNRNNIVEAVEKTIRQLREKPPSSERLALTKKRFRNAIITSWFEAPDDLASQVAWYTNYEPDFGVFDRFMLRLDEVTPAMIQQFANDFLVDKGKTTVTLVGEVP